MAIAPLRTILSLTVRGLNVDVTVTKGATVSRLDRADVVAVVTTACTGPEKIVCRM